ncbi:hypothetical protein BDV24DRAFT_175618 [Aspergillus arachidicola]|uniref:Peroxisomal-coenzyme A synthetase n=1 Tax=Aspergillus arachidicola TaxID=656916 RepID=A0A5N6YQX5_9EURO|nr:hypothetical protein BDV24DRAFT_175618 [Aspergillus arachidicola]
MTRDIESTRLPGNGVISLEAYQQNDTPVVIIPRTESSTSLVVTYRELYRAIIRLQTDLGQLGIGENMHLALSLPNGLEFIVSFLSGVAQRATVAPINPGYTQQEALTILRRIQPSLLLVSCPGPVTRAAHDLSIPAASCVWDSESNMVRLQLVSKIYEPCLTPAVAPSNISPDDNALMLFTSGTTGTPKCVVLTHRNLLVAVSIITRAHGLSPGDRCALITPLFHVAGVGASLLTTIFSGGAVVIPPSLSGAFWTQLQESGVTWYHAVPTLHQLLLTFPRPSNMPALRFIRSGGSSLAPVTLQRLEEELATPVLEIYGMTETAPGIFCNRLDGARRSSCYPIAPEVTVRIRQSDNGGKDPVMTDQIGVVGEICVRGPSIMHGYVDNPEANEGSFVDGFFRTGDLGMLDENHTIRLTGRIKEIINKGGEKIDPTEVEQIFHAHEAIREVVCFRIKDEAYGEEIGLAVALNEGHDLNARQVKMYARKNAVSFKVPKKVVFLEVIPRNQTGKYQRQLLSRQYGS